MKLVKYICKDLQVEIEYYDILIIDELFEDLFVYCKVDIVVLMVLLNNCFIVCIYFNRLECILVCSENYF